MGGTGNLVHLTGNKVDSNTQRRMAGVQQAVDETNGQVKLLDTITDIDTDLQTAQKAVADLLAAKGTQINAIVNTAYNPAVASAAGGQAVRSSRSRSSRSTTTRPSSRASRTARSPRPCCRTRSARPTSARTR